MSRARFNPLDQIVCLERPHCLVPSGWTEHVPFVMYLVGAVQPQVVVDLATGDGVLYLGFCQAIRSLNLEAKAIAVRPQRHSEPDDDETSATLRTLQESCYSSFSRLLETTTDDAESLFDPQSIDLLHLNGGREVEVVAREFHNWRAKLSRFGVVLIDDVVRRSGNFGVSELWDELKQRFPSFTFDHGRGLGVLAVGEDAAGLIEGLVRAEAAEVSDIRRFFSSLGRMQKECSATLRANPADSSRLLIRTGVQADRIERLLSALRDYRRKLAEASAWQSILDERSASLTWRIVDRLSRAGARIAPRGSKRRGMLRFGFRAVRGAARSRVPEFIAALRSSFVNRFRDTLPGKMVGAARECLTSAREFNRFQREIRSDPPSLPEFSSIGASIIIPDSKGPLDTLACLKSIASHAPGVTFEVIVVSERSARQTSSTLGQIPGLVVAGSPRNSGFARSCARGAAIARGEYLVFLQNTATVTDGWIAAMAATFQELPEVGLVAPKRLHLDGRLKNEGETIECEATGSRHSRTDDPEHPRHNFVRELESCWPACMMIPRDLFSQIGGFDVEFDREADAGAALAFNVRRAGYGVFYQPAARIFDRESLDHGAAATPAAATLRLINQPHFRNRSSERIDSQQARASSRALNGTDSAAVPSRKGRVLVIDWSLPRPDQDSGSFRMMEILKAIRASGNHVAFVPADMAYNAPYARNLQRIGVEVAYQPFYPSVPEYLEQHGQEFELVIVSRADIASRFVEPVRRSAPRAKLVFDTVDLHYLREERAAELLNSTRLRNVARRRKRQELVLASQCDATLVVSPVEQAILERECPEIDVRLLSNVMDVPRDEPPGYDSRRHLVFIGGFGHAPNVDAVVYFVGQILPLVLERLPDLVLQIVGSDAPDRIRDLAGTNIQVLGYVPEVKPIFDRAWVSVAPLRFGAGVKGKVNQSMALGVPTVVTPVAAEGMHLVHEHNSMIADDPASFADSIVRLCTSRELWERISANGRENVREHFSVESASRQIDELLAFAGLGSRLSPREEVDGPSTKLIATGSRGGVL